MKNKNTTIKITKETKERIDKLKEFSRETYDEVIRKLLFILNITKKDPEKAQKILDKIDSSIKRKEGYEIYQDTTEKNEDKNRNKRGK